METAKLWPPVPEIRSRKKAYPLVVTMYLPGGLEATARISPPFNSDQWWAAFAMPAEELGRYVQRYFIKPVLDFVSKEPERGIHKGRTSFMDGAKAVAGYTFVAVNYYLKRPREEWPESLKERVRWLEMPIQRRVPEVCDLVRELPQYSHGHRVNALSLTIIYTRLIFDSCRKIVSVFQIDRFTEKVLGTMDGL